MKPLTITVECACGEGVHETTAWPVGDGLAVNRSNGAGPEVWVITHLPSGRRLPARFADPEAAVACATRIAGLWGWATLDVPPAEVQDEARLLLAEFGGQPGTRRARHELTRRNGGLA